MGLQKDISYKGLLLKEGYAKVVHFDGNKYRMYFNVEYYVDKKTADGDMENTDYLYISQMYSFVPDMKSHLNLWEQAYRHLRSLQEFQSASDA